MTWWLTLKNLQVKWVSTLITLLVVALSCSIAMVVPLVTLQVQKGAQDAAQVFDLLIARKGSPTQALINSLFYLDVPIGNLPYSEFEKLKKDPRTRRVVPLGFGDNYVGFPVVGTSTDFFTLQLTPEDPPYFQLQQGELFEKPFQAVIGQTVAREANLQVGSTFETMHGMHEIAGEHSEEEEHHQAYQVVGILKPTGGPADRAVYTDLSTLWETHEVTRPEDRSLTAMLFTGKNLADLYTVAGEINQGNAAQAIFPGQVFAQVSGFVMQGQQAYTALAVLVLILAGLTVGLSVYASSLQRMKTVSILRALGARPQVVFQVVLLETIFSVTLGVLLGVGLAYLLSLAGGSLLTSRLGFSLPAPELQWDVLWKVLCLIPLGALFALPPAIRASRTSPLKHL